MSTSPDDKERILALESAIRMLQGAANQGVNPPNLVSLPNSAPGNNQGMGGPTAIAYVAATCLYTGVFRWSAKAQATTVAGDVSTWTVTSQTGAGAITTTGATTLVQANAAAVPAPGANSLGIILAPTFGGNMQTGLSNGMAGTGIVITAGGGGAKTQDSSARTIGAGATLQDFYSASGLMVNVAPVAGAPQIQSASVQNYRTASSFPLGSNVFLILSYTNSAANRAISGIELTLEEVQF